MNPYTGEVERLDLTTKKVHEVSQGDLVRISNDVAKQLQAGQATLKNRAQRRRLAAAARRERSE